MGYVNSLEGIHIKMFAYMNAHCVQLGVWSLGSLSSLRLQFVVQEALNAPVSIEASGLEMVLRLVQVWRPQSCHGSMEK